MHAYAILAHKNLDQLHRLVRTLDTGQASFFLHIDKKADIAPYKRELDDLGRMPNVEFVRRYHSPWASFGIVQAQRAAMEAALRAKPRFTHVTLLTGQDYPIRAPHEIDAFFAAHQGTSFMRFFERGKRKGRRRLLEPPHQAWRYKNWYLYFAGKHRRISSNLLKKVGIKRRIPGGLRPVKGWPSLPSRGNVPSTPLSLSNTTPAICVSLSIQCSQTSTSGTLSCSIHL